MENMHTDVRVKRVEKWSLMIQRVVLKRNMTRGALACVAGNFV